MEEFAVIVFTTCTFRLCPTTFTTTFNHSAKAIYVPVVKLAHSASATDNNDARRDQPEQQANREIQEQLACQDPRARRANRARRRKLSRMWEEDARNARQERPDPRDRRDSRARV